MQLAWYFTGDSTLPDVVTPNPMTEWVFDVDPDVKEQEVVLEFISSIGEKICTWNDTDTVHIIPMQHLWVPTAFSPNNDDLNDYWDIYSEVVDPSTFSVQIFNRWGRHVADLDASNFNQRNTGWDGTYDDSGEPAQEGVYVYVLKAKSYPNANGERYGFDRSGSITLIR